MQKPLTNRHSAVPVLLAGIALIALFLPGCGGPSTSEDVKMPEGIPLPVEEDRPYHEQEVRHMAISPDGSVLATGSSDSLLLWRTNDMKPFAVVSAETEFQFIQDMVLSPGGRYVGVLNRAGKFYLWDTESLKKREIRNRWGDDPLRLLGFDQQDRLYWITIDERLLVWDLGEGVLEAGAPTELGFVGRSSTVARAGEHWLLRGPQVFRLDALDEPTLSGLDVTWPDPLPQAPPIPLAGKAAENSDEATSGTAMNTGLVGVFDNDVWKVGTLEGNRQLKSRAVRAASGPGDLVAETAVDPTGRWLAVAWDSGGIELWDLQKEELSGQLKIGSEDVRAVHPIKVLDLVMNRNTFFVLLPEQKLVWYRVGDWLRQGELQL